MNVACPECKSVYRVDPAKVPEAGVRARCSVCGGVIGIGKAGAIDDDYAPALRVRTPESVPVAAARPRTPVRPIAVADPAPVASSQSQMPDVPPSLARPAPSAPSAPPRPAPAAGAAPMPPVSPTRSAGTMPLAPAQARPPQPVPSPSAGGARSGPMTGLAPAVRRPGGDSAEPRPQMPAGASANSGGMPPGRPPAEVPVRSAGAGAPAAGGAAANRVAVVPGGGLPARPAAPAGATAGGAAARRPINPFLNNDPNVKARRLARALVSDLTAYYPDKRREGLASGRLKELFKEEIKKSWEEYVEQVGKEFAENTSHFRDALNEILAGGAKVF